MHRRHDDVERRRSSLGVATVSDQVGDIFRHSYTTQAAATTKAKATKGVLSVIDIRLTDGEGGQDSDSSAKHAV
jgi:hypothetical protein